LIETVHSPKTFPLTKITSLSRLNLKKLVAVRGFESRSFNLSSSRRRKKEFEYFIKNRGSIQ